MCILHSHTHRPLGEMRAVTFCRDEIEFEGERTTRPNFLLRGDEIGFDGAHNAGGPAPFLSALARCSQIGRSRHQRRRPACRTPVKSTRPLLRRRRRKEEEEEFTVVDCVHQTYRYIYIEGVHRVRTRTCTVHVYGIPWYTEVAIELPR